MRGNSKRRWRKMRGKGEGPGGADKKRVVGTGAGMKDRGREEEHGRETGRSEGWDVPRASSLWCGLVFLASASSPRRASLSLAFPVAAPVIILF